MKKILYSEGCSWTGGHLGDNSNMLKPGLEDSQLMSKENESYRLPKLWPHKLGKLLNIENVHNAGEPGSSNDGVVRRTVENVLGLLKNYSPDEILVVVGWTSPERKDFFYRETGETDSHWLTLQPAQNMEFYNSDAKDLKHFFKTYVRCFWHPEEFFHRYVRQNLYLHYFLKSHNIEHLFYSSFYENPDVGIDDMGKEMYDLIPPNTLENFHGLCKTSYKDLTFRNYVQEVHIDENSNNKHQNKFFADHHPTELGHRLWSEELARDLDYIKNE
tara:strand:+ start:790 stop:1608 length:819 start_codon:yes stop_codon:yes gene_type:complete